MKIGNWTRKLASALVAAGIWIPSIVYAANIPLGDPSFEAYTVPASGYAYADEYRPTSAWVDDMDSPGGYTQDDVDSNWMYNANYAENGSTVRKRGAPRTGTQAMHGGSNYSGQLSSAIFEAGMTYEFSVYAQGDDDADGGTSRVWMYIFDGSVPFSEANSLEFARYAPDTGDFLNRGAGMTEAESQANWTQITISHDAVAGAAEIGQPVGVAVWGAADAGVDDGSLRSFPTIPEPSTVILVGIGGLALLGRRRRE
jgi:PEP-CTERM motif-containing protein